MITVFYRENNVMQLAQLSAGDEIPAGTQWIDMKSPTSEEMNAIEKQLKIEIPTQREVWKNHVLNRLYVEDGVAYMTAAIITKVDSPYPGTSAVTFILAPNFLLTLHEIAPTSFNNMAQRLLNPHTHFPNATYLLEALLEEMITRVAHNSELVVETLDQLSHDIFGTDVIHERARNSSQLMKIVLRRLGAAADLNSKINESLHSITRMLVFFKQVVTSTNKDIDNNIDILIKDTDALTTQTAFLSDKVTFQLDATLGMINVEQNVIIKIFSVVAVFFMPPTLVSSLYGMNFRYMPELSWAAGYPMALGLMFICALVPFVYFRRRGWL